MFDEPILRATTESGDTTLDPSEDVLFMLLDEDVESGASNFIIVESLADESKQTYAQAYRNEDGTYDVEYRAGGPEEHYGTRVSDFREAHALLTGWAFDVDGWRESAEWSLLRF